MNTRTFFSALILTAAAGLGLGLGSAGGRAPDVAAAASGDVPTQSCDAGSTLPCNAPSPPADGSGLQSAAGAACRDIADTAPIRFRA